MNNIAMSDSNINCIIYRDSGFLQIYNQDKAKYGDPSDSGHKVVDTQELDDWQVILLSHAKNVEPTNKRKSPSA